MLYMRIMAYALKPAVLWLLIQPIDLYSILPIIVAFSTTPF